MIYLIKRTFQENSRIQWVIASLSSVVLKCFKEGAFSHNMNYKKKQRARSQGKQKADYLFYVLTLIAFCCHNSLELEGSKQSNILNLKVARSAPSTVRLLEITRLTPSFEKNKGHQNRLQVQGPKPSREKSSSP